MRICLPDVNVLIALHDPLHSGYERAHQWFNGDGQHGWATCPLTENGFVRITCQPHYQNGINTASEALLILDNMTSRHAAGHQFWHDSPSLRDQSLFMVSAIASHKQITDVYLLGLCQQNGGPLVTLDTGITVQGIVAPDADLLHIL
ncbi:MAG: TA system VapC family ribonuclease toxin [Capsulimonadaceae bacterium]